MIKEHDEKNRYCPMLGHALTFKYCRSLDDATPCRKIYDCWWEHFDIKSFMNSHFSQDVLAKLQDPGGGRMGLLYKSILQAQKNLDKSEDEK